MKQNETKPKLSKKKNKNEAKKRDDTFTYVYVLLLIAHLYDSLAAMASIRSVGTFPSRF